MLFYLFDYFAGSITWFLSIKRSVNRRRWWHPTPVLLPGKPHGRRSLVGCSPWGREELEGERSQGQGLPELPQALFQKLVKLKWTSPSHNTHPWLQRVRSWCSARVRREEERTTVSKGLSPWAGIFADALPKSALLVGFKSCALKIVLSGTSLVAQWLRICLPIQGTLVWCPVGELRSHMQLNPCATTREAQTLQRKIVQLKPDTAKLIS